MKKEVELFALRSLSVLVICLLSAFLSFANNKDADIAVPKNVSSKTLSIAAENLTKKLKQDLVTENVRIKFTTVTQYAISKSQTGLKGEGFCVLTKENNQLPIRFDVKVDNLRKDVLEVKYDFLQFEEPSEFAPTATEEILTRELMKQISRDYNTQDVVVAIDGFEKIEGEKILGNGEVRVGGMWKKIKFDVALNELKPQAKKVIYKLE
ncbi:MAG TPA: hypothetical protein VK892_12310 [Pyrinomonadaceae bacterium]|nr:hypothetical protein [Pyrinomonadaceae bacterium]